jgi:hypothetical protein
MRTLEKAIDAELRCGEIAKVIFSGEGLCQLPLSAVERLRAFLDPWFSKIRIVVYVRDPFEYASSAAQERIKRGVATFETLGERPPAPRYRFHIEKYQQVFGAPNVDIRKFHPAGWARGSIYADFCEAIGESPELADRLHVIEGNRSLSGLAVQVLEAVNRQFPAAEDGVLTPARAAINRECENLEGEPFLLDAGSLSKLSERIGDDVAWLKEVTGGRIDFTFSRPPPAASRPVDLPPDEVAILAEKLTKGLRSAEAKINGDP